MSVKCKQELNDTIDNTHEGKRRGGGWREVEIIFFLIPELSIFKTNSIISRENEFNIFLFGCPIIIYDFPDRFASNFDWGTHVKPCECS